MAAYRGRALMWLNIALGGTAAIGGAGAMFGIVPIPEEIKNMPLGIARFGRAAIVATKIMIDYKKNLYSGGVNPDMPNYAAIKSEVHQRSAEKLLNLCCVNGGAFIKIGQHLGALEYLLPIEYVRTLQVLHSDAPKSDLESVLYVLKQELKEEASTLFSWFSPEPVGAASLAQVHLATTHDGRTLAVKVQHKAVREYATVDLKGMELLVSIVGTLFPDFNFDWLVEETKRNLPQELDFEAEGHNADRAAQMFKHFPWLKIPSIDWSLSTNRVLTMEYCEGGQVNDPEYMKQHGISPEQVVERLGLLYSEMIFCSGYVHSDPHPGNVIVRQLPGKQGVQVVLLDHGLYAKISDSTRHAYSRLWLAILSQDVEGITRYGQELGAGELAGLFACMVTARSWKSITQGIDTRPVDSAESLHITEYAKKLVPQIISTLSHVNRQMLLLLKTNDLLRGIEHALGIQKSQKSFLTMSRCCVRSVYENELSVCTSLGCRLSTRFHQAVALSRIDALSTYLAFRNGLSVVVARWSESVIARTLISVSAAPGVDVLIDCVKLLYRMLGKVFVLVLLKKNQQTTWINLDDHGIMFEDELVLD